MRDEDLCVECAQKVMDTILGITQGGREAQVRAVVALCKEVGVLGWDVPAVQEAAPVDIAQEIVPEEDLEPAGENHTPQGFNATV